MNLLQSCLLFALLFFSAAVHSQTTQASECAALHAIFLRGEGTDGGPFNGQVMTPLSDQIVSTIPNSSSIAIAYDSGNLDKPVAVYNASMMFNEYVAQYVESCPDSKIMVLGYSLGADGVMDSLCGTSSILYIPSPTLDLKYRANIALIVIFAEESYVSGQAWNTGNCTSGHGVRIY